MKKNDILCAVDFSESSIDALKWSIDLARKSGAKITIMFCYRLINIFHNEEIRDLKRNIEQDAKLKFRELEEKHLKGQAVTYTFICEVGFYHSRIDLFLHSHPVGAVVIGNAIVQNFDENRNLGFAQFLKNINVPVVVVPSQDKQEAEILAQTGKVLNR